MARRSPKNPVNDIINTVGGWLGGRGPGTNPQVQAAMQATRAIARTADTATGGFGQALLSDAQRMAMTGSSTPSALYKTAAVNLGAAAAGVGAAKVAGKVVKNSRIPKFDWDPKPYRDIPSPGRADMYWTPQTEVVNVRNPDISYTTVVRPVNPKAKPFSPRSADMGYRVEVTRFDSKAINETLDSAAEYRKITNDTSNTPSVQQLIREIENRKVYKTVKKAQKAAERSVRKDTKRR